MTRFHMAMLVSQNIKKGDHVGVPNPSRDS